MKIFILVRDNVFNIGVRICEVDSLQISMLWDVATTCCQETEITSQTKDWDTCDLPVPVVRLVSNQAKI